MRQTLATKFVLLIFAIVVVGFVNGLTALIFTWAVADSLNSVVNANLPAVKAAEELEIQLSDQRGHLSAYIISEGDPSWLERSRKAEAEFDDWFSRARAGSRTPEEHGILNGLARAFAEYHEQHGKAVRQFDQGCRDEAFATLLHGVWPAYDEAYQLCEEYIDANETYVREATRRAGQYVAFATWGVLSGCLGSAGLAVALAWMVVRRVLGPLRRMVADARVLVGNPLSVTVDSLDDELRSVGAYFGRSWWM